LRNAKANAPVPNANTIAEQIFFAPPETENFHPIAGRLQTSGRAVSPGSE